MNETVQKKDELNAVVTHIMRVSPIMIIIRVAPEGWELPEFKPGQFVPLFLPPTAPRCSEASEEFKTPDPDKMIRRAYSVASSSKTNDYLEFYITLVHSGSLTPRLFELKIGDKIGVGKKLTGMFTLDKVSEEKNIVLVATGTGVAPYMSMLRSDALQHPNRKITVLHGASNSWDLGYSSELTLLQSMSPKFKYIPTILFPEKEPTKWKGDTRFLQEMWKDDVVGKAWGEDITPENTEVFLCGNPNMIEAMINAMADKGFKEHKPKEPGEIHVERF